MMKEKILLLGCAGLIGSHLADELVKDYFVVGVDNLSLGTKDNIKHLISKMKTNKSNFVSKSWRCKIRCFRKVIEINNDIQ